MGLEHDENHKKGIDKVIDVSIPPSGLRTKQDRGCFGEDVDAVTIPPSGLRTNNTREAFNPYEQSPSHPVGSEHI